jgi:hypothetical protein
VEFFAGKLPLLMVLFKPEKTQKTAATFCVMKFILQKEAFIPRIGNVQKYRHRTGLEWIHVNHESNNNVFKYFPLN